MLSLLSPLKTLRSASSVLFALVCWQGSALAEKYEVTTPFDTIDKDLTDNICADTSGLCSLRAAIQNANKTPDSDTIKLAEDTYKINIPGNDHSAETGDAYGDLDIAHDLILNGEGVDKSFISVTDGLQDRVLHILTGAVVTVTGLTIQNGSTTQTNPPYNTQTGGGIFIEPSATLDISNCFIKNNISNYSGGGISNSGNLIVENCQFNNNQAPGFFGGGIFIGVSANQVSINNSTFNDNSSGIGGAIHHGSKRNASISNSVIYDNTGTSGTGGVTTGWTDAVLTIVNSTVSGNTSQTNGAGMSTMSLNSTMHVNNCTITNNVSKLNAGGIANYGTMKLRNSLVASNISIANGNQDCSGTIISEGYNLLGVNANCNYIASTSDIVGTINNPVNAKLAPLANTGGTTLTHALLTGSPAIDAGNPATPGSGGLACESTDQRGVDRARTGRICDIGAHEVSAGADVWVAFANESKTQANNLQLQTIHLGNNGTDNARNVKLVIVLDDGSEFQSISAEDWVCSQSSGNSFTCTLALLASATEYELTIQTLPPGGVSSYLTKAFISSETPDPLSDNNEAEMTVIINEAPVIYVDNRVTLNKPYGAIASQIAITDKENDELTQASIRINSGYNPDIDTLVLADSSSITTQWDGTTGTLLLLGNDTLSNYQNALQQVQYNSSETDEYTGSRIMTITVSDSYQSSLPAVLSLSLVAATNKTDDDLFDANGKDPFADDRDTSNENSIDKNTYDSKAIIEEFISVNEIYDNLIIYIFGKQADSEAIGNEVIINGKVLTTLQRNNAWISIDSILSNAYPHTYAAISVGAVFFAGVVGLFGRLGSVIALLFSSPLLIQFDPVPVVLISKSERQRRAKEFERIRSQEDSNKGLTTLFDDTNEH